MNSKRIISFGKQWQRLKRLQLFLDNVQRATTARTWISALEYLLWLLWALVANDKIFEIEVPDS